MRAVENADGVSGLEAECEIDLHFYNSCTTGEKRLYSYYRHRGRAHKMGQFLNNKEPYDKYRTVKNGPYFVDKSEILEELIPALQQEQRFFCITRPRRFGKTIMANMIAAFFENTEEESLFDDLYISRYKHYKEQAGRHDVIYIDFSEMPKECDSYKKYISRIEEGIYYDLREKYSDLYLKQEDAIWDIFSKIFNETKKKFIFVMDEWDAVFHMSFMTEKNREDYLLFLKLLLKGQSYVELAYMTGVLPIAKYSDGSELNMFLEYNMATRIRFSEYFGFSDEEVDKLYEKYLQNTKKPQIDREGLREWYDGYHTASGQRLYNPRSVVCALSDNQLSNYWVSSGKYDSVFSYVKNNIDDVQEDLVLMFAGEKIPSGIEEYAATAQQLDTKEEIYSAMVVYGLLTYDNGCVFIPNKELQGSYASMMKKEKSLGYIYRLANISNKMLQATLNKDTDTMAEILQYAHNTETPILSYNNEVELSAIVNLVYLSARDFYRIEREDKAGKGFVDFIFYPVRYEDKGIILELKVDQTPEEAIKQIKEKDYILRFKGKLGEHRQYPQNILAVGISYDKITKKHTCKIEELLINS